jgi:hypothetical protein
MADQVTEFVKWYLRFNGYFSIEGFVVHAADKIKKIDGDTIPQQTECDLLSIRLPYSREFSADLCMANDPQIVNGGEEKTDILICEVKSGIDNAPNPVWKHASTHQDMVEYIVRFCGVFPDDDVFKSACRELSKKYEFKGNNTRIRYIIFSKEPFARHQKRGVTYITFRSIIEFLVSIRGQSWQGAKLGVASKHQQWPKFVRCIFDIANYHDGPIEEKMIKVEELLRINSKELPNQANSADAKSRAAD